MERQISGTTAPCHLKRAGNVERNLQFIVGAKAMDSAASPTTKIFKRVRDWAKGYVFQRSQSKGPHG